MNHLLLAPFWSQADAHPQRIALVLDEQRISYADLRDRSLGLAMHLRDAGVAPGDRVALLLDNSEALVTGILAVQILGAVTMALHPLTRAEKLAGILHRTEAKALLTHRAFAPAWRASLAAAPACLAWVEGLEHAEPSVATWPAPETLEVAARRAGEHGGFVVPLASTQDQDALAFISHTSGTTGVPKGVMLSQGNLRWVCDTVAEYLGLRADDRIGCALPLSFNYGLTHLWMALSCGASLVLDRGFSFPLAVTERWKKEGVTMAPLVPTSLALLLQHASFNARELPTIRTVTNAAAALPAVLQDALLARFPEVALFSMYGQTECTRISYLPPDELATHPRSVGRGLKGQDHWLEDESGQRLPLGSTGQLVVSGPHVMLGYWNDAEETARKISEGPLPHTRTLHTGDLFRSEASGHLHFVARSDDIIKTRGEKVSPREVEDALLRLEGVRECAVLGVDDPLLGQAVHAFVVADPQAALSERLVIRHCLNHLESYMAPKFVSFVDTLPKTENGKVLKRSLRDQTS
jgi:acyl-CoA synthetase (AMP-forming)/AMP-acid ligase II